MKKTFLITLLMLAFGLFNSANAYQIGTVDYSKMYAGLPQSIALQKQIDAKLQEIKNYSIATKKIIDSKIPDADKRKQVAPRIEQINKLKQQYGDLRKKQEEIVFAKTKIGADAVIKSKKVDVVVNKNYLISGGIDVTQDVLKAAK